MKPLFLTLLLTLSSYASSFAQLAGPGAMPTSALGSWPTYYLGALGGIGSTNNGSALGTEKTIGKRVIAKVKSFTQPLVPAESYGFSTSDSTGTSNFEALATMATVANLQGHLYVKFVGTYKIRVPAKGELGYLGAGNHGKCLLRRLDGVVIDASKAVFQVSNETYYDHTLIEFSHCQNVSVVADFRGTHTGQLISGVGAGCRGIWFRNDNHKVNLALSGRQMFSIFEIGTYEDPVGFNFPYGQNNSHFDIHITYADVYYGARCYLADNVNIYLEGHGTPGNFGCHRAVYFAGCNNCRAVSQTKNIGVQDGINLVSSTPRVGSPNHLGSSNIWIDARDLGTTLNVAYQVLVKINIMASTTIQTPVEFNNININVDCKITASNWGNNSVIYFGSRGQGHVFRGITVSGCVTRTVPSSTTGPTVAFDYNTAGVASFDLKFLNFQENYVTTPTTLKCYVSGVPLVAHTWQSIVGDTSFKDSSIQSLRLH